MLPPGSFSNKQQLVVANRGTEHYEKEFLGQKCSKVCLLYAQERNSLRSIYALLRPAVWHKAVLEVATGTEQVAKHLLCSADHIEATDASAAMIAQAKRGNFSSKLHFSVQDMFHLPYADQSFDVVIVSNALHIVPHPEKALIEFRRVLKNDGTLIAPTFTHAENSPWGNLQALALKIAGFPLHSRWTSAAYLAFLQQNGWTVCKSVVLQNSIPLTYAECKKVERR